MPEKKLIMGILTFSLLAGLWACKAKGPVAEEPTPEPAHTPVSVTFIKSDTLQAYVELNATSVFLQKSYVKSNLTGYLKSVFVKFGDPVAKGQLLFSLKTKEAEAIGNSVNRLNPDFKFSGVNNVLSNVQGFVTELDHQQGDYVQDGEQLAVLSDGKSFAFVMNVPYELLPYVTIGKMVDMILPGDQHLPAKIASRMPLMDSISQTQSFVLRPATSRNIPQNLVAIARIQKVFKPSARTLPKSAALADETQSEFWIMKLIDDSTAVKVPVTKGIESGDRVEIISPSFDPKDRIVLNGNYGLPDTALVIVHK